MILKTYDSAAQAAIARAPSLPRAERHSSSQILLQNHHSSAAQDYPGQTTALLPALAVSSCKESSQGPSSKLGGFSVTRTSKDLDLMDRFIDRSALNLGTLNVISSMSGILPPHLKSVRTTSSSGIIDS
ncbi:hypothetical protein CEUSTIGMA_g9504.t1 [Chlamydomonas eustigma]|uniref:Uncharacterized protein n=1 Tax=Chlamydomonas eustigma TaxID=1157962 RepID=A0A250XGC1_9CHLO|nr:hypothetical protein CEUSTIGMA_g9504.t1 [Chlamydomonas eustigma]|eukprot:GAX82076.1 hypothetical protein CEUSTIGMA_g9504.t1 [Chlamydomonas eustigma]